MAVETIIAKQNVRENASGNNVTTAITYTSMALLDGAGMDPARKGTLMANLTDQMYSHMCRLSAAKRPD